MRSQSIVGLCLAVFAGFACPAAGAAYLVTASGPLVSVLSDAKAFDGSSITALPNILDLGRLQGGSFRAMYQFTPVTPNPPNGGAFYDLSPTSGMIVYELLDPNGVVVHRGTSPSEPIAILQNGDGSLTRTVDQVVLSSHVNDVTGLHVPSPLYSQNPDFLSMADFNVAGDVGNGVNYLNDLSIPTDAATYLSFPTTNGGMRAFTVGIEFGDGDYVNRSGPYQRVFAGLQYDIAALQVTQVPEPMSAPAFAVVWVGLLQRRGWRSRRMR